MQADNVGDQLSLPPADWDHRPPYGVHVREAALRLEYVRLLVDHTSRALVGASTAPLWQTTGAFETDEMTDAEEKIWTASGVTPVGDESPEAVAWSRYSAYLNDGLGEISPRILGQDIASEPDFGDVTTSYAAACAMVFNDLRDGLPYRQCADETCGRLFRRQLGRSKGINKPRSSGVEFCTWSHARNQSRRERRRAERQEEGRP